MNVSDILCNVTELLGEKVELQGIFVLVGEDGYFVDTVDKRDNLKEAIRIDIPEIADVVIQNVPPFGGSKYSYADPAEITGEILKCENGDVFRYKISNVERFFINKSGHVLSVFD